MRFPRSNFSVLLFRPVRRTVPLLPLAYLFLSAAAAFSTSMEDISLLHKQSGLQRPLSSFRSIKGGGSSITIADIEDMNRYLIPSLDGELGLMLANLLNFGWDSLQEGTRWHFKKDAQGHITGAILNDLRDHYTRCFCRLEELDALMTEALDCTAGFIHFGATPIEQWPLVEAFFARNEWFAYEDFFGYVLIRLSDYNKFNEALKMLQKLSPHLKAERLRFPDDAEFIDRSWTYYSPTSYPPIGESIYSRPSMCVRDPEHVGIRSTPDFTLTNDLVGWILCRSDGSLGSLRVLEQYRNQGLGKILSAMLVEKLLAVPLIPEVASVAAVPRIQPIAYIDPENEASFKIHEALGFTRSKMYGFLKWYPKQAPTNE